MLIKVVVCQIPSILKRLIVEICVRYRTQSSLSPVPPFLFSFLSPPPLSGFRLLYGSQIDMNTLGMDGCSCGCFKARRKS